jgi:hypothetical protein
MAAALTERKKMKVTIGLLVSCLLAGPFVRAQESQPDLDPRPGVAKKACIAGELQKAIPLLADLYTDTNDPIWIFNQGRCYQQNAEPTKASSRFKEFLRKYQGSQDDEIVRNAQKYINEIDTEVQQKQAAAAAAAAPVDTTPPPPNPEPSAATLTSKPLTSEAAPEAASTNVPFYKKWWIWTGVGAVVVAGTVTAFLIARKSGGNGCTGISPYCTEYYP